MHLTKFLRVNKIINTNNRATLKPFLKLNRSNLITLKQYAVFTMIWGVVKMAAIALSPTDCKNFKLAKLVTISTLNNTDSIIKAMVKKINKLVMRTKKF